MLINYHTFQNKHFKTIHFFYMQYLKLPEKLLLIGIKENIRLMEEFD